MFDDEIFSQIFFTPHAQNQHPYILFIYILFKTISKTVLLGRVPRELHFFAMMTSLRSGKKFASSPGPNPPPSAMDLGAQNEPKQGKGEKKRLNVYILYWSMTLMVPLTGI